MSITRTDGAERTYRLRSGADDGPPTTRRELPPANHEALAARQLERVRPASDYLAFLASVPAAASTSADAARDKAVQAKLDSVRDAFSGPFLVDGVEVSARPMFRMYHRRSRENVAMVTACANRAGVPAGPAIFGQCTPRQLVKITQALLDAGCLPPGRQDLAARIRQMQWSYGIGIDCAGYSREALVATALRTPVLYGPGAESFRDLDGARAGSFAKQSLEHARPGDLITLDEIPPEKYGHNVVVYRHAIADAAQGAALVARHGAEVAAFMASAGPHHVLEVDSSWGAGIAGNECGGFRRDTWIYDASTKLWGSFDPRSTPPRFEIASRGPSGDAYHGTYRPR